MTTRVAVVSGASTPMGQAIVLELLSSSFKVLAQINVQPFEDAVIPHHLAANLAIIRHSLSNDKEAQAFIDHVSSMHNRIDLLVNLIGPMQHKNLDEVSISDWQQQMHFNVDLNFYLSHFALPWLKQSMGHIINFGYAGVENLSADTVSTAYSVAKAGLVVLTKSMAQSLAKYQIRVNAINPGLIEAGEATDPERKKLAQEIPFGRPGSPREVARVLSWLVNESPSYVTGALIPVAGAWEY